METMGINQLANMFLGNPQPLAAKVQQAQQQAKPGQIPPDLEAAIALQKIQEMRNAAMNQQAMQSGGPQPTVVDQLKKAVAPQAAPQGLPQGMGQPSPQGIPQGMPPGAPQQPPQGTPQQGSSGLPQLPTSLGQHLAGGGIIAFAGDEGSYVDERDIMRRMEAGYDPAVTERLNAANTRPPMVMPAESSNAARNILSQGVMTDPEQFGRKRVAQYDTDIGAPNLEVFNRAAQELDARKQQIQAPAKGLDSLMEYVRQIAAAPKGMGSLSAGAYGAQKAREVDQQREQQQFELSKQILDIEQKKIDALRAYAKEKFNIGDAAFNQMFKVNFDAAKQITANDVEAEKIAAHRTENQLKRESEEKMAKERNATSIATANAPGQTERIAARIEKLRAQGTPEADAQIKQILDTHAQITGSGAAGVGAQRNQIMEMRIELAANQAILKDPDSTDEERAEAKQSIASLKQQLANSRANIPGKSTDNMAEAARKAPPPPPGFVKQ